jgi:hypothetical protein
MTRATRAPTGHSGSSTVFMRYHLEWQPSPAEIAAEGGADRRSAKIAAAPMGQSREAHYSARPHLSPKGGQSPAVFAGDWPPAGALACGNTDAEGEVGYAGRVRRVLRMVWRRVLRRV